jgi:DNA-binding transcriptional regulator YiaG
LGIAQRQIHIKFNKKQKPKDRANQLQINIQMIGDWIKVKRMEKFLTSGHVAEKMGIAHAMVRTWEEGPNGPSQEQIQDLIGVFGETPPFEIVH